MTDVFTLSLVREILSAFESEAWSTAEEGSGNAQSWLNFVSNPALWESLYVLLNAGLVYMAAILYLLLSITKAATASSTSNYSTPITHESSISSSSSSILPSGVDLEDSLEATLDLGNEMGDASPRGVVERGGGNSGKKMKHYIPVHRYVPPLMVPIEFRDRWRNRWRHQQYHEIMSYSNGEQYEIKNFRPTKNTFVQQKKTEMEISVNDYKRHCDLSKKVCGYETPADARAKKPSVVYKAFFREKKATKEGGEGKKRSGGKKRQHGHGHNMQCNFCSQNFDYNPQYLQLPPYTSSS
jgi:hypothetical protein